MEASGKYGLDKSVAGHSPFSLPIGSGFGGSIRPVLLLSNWRSIQTFLLICLPVSKKSRIFVGVKRVV